MDHFGSLQDSDVPQNLSMDIGAADGAPVEARPHNLTQPITSLATGPHDLSQPISTLAAGLYEPHMNMGIKSERSLPLTPPGKTVV